MTYVPRNAEIQLRRDLELFPCIGITGPRQSGKSTMIRQVLRDCPYVTFDDPDEERAFRDDPRGFMNRFPDRAIFDEVQRVPELFRYVKMWVDAAPSSRGRFILTGSNQFSLQKNISESLAGRIGLQALLPFETSELPLEARKLQILYGSYPALATRAYEGAREWYAAYFSTYIEKDVRLVYEIGKLADFQALVRLLAARTGAELNSSALSRELGVSANTVDSWISVLEAGYIVFRLPPFHGNIGKRIIKRPKLYFWDTGLVSYLTGLRDIESLEGGPLAGPIFETLIVSELQKKCAHRGLERDFWFYRDYAGGEIDLVLRDYDAKLVEFIEIKSGRTPKSEWARRLEEVSRPLRSYFEPEGLRFRDTIIYRGETQRDWPKPGTDFVNWQEMLIS
jgi:Predicted ATPase (AAA+ superfamily)